MKYRHEHVSNTLFPYGSSLKRNIFLCLNHVGKQLRRFFCVHQFLHAWQQISTAFPSKALKTRQVTRPQMPHFLWCFAGVTVEKICLGGQAKMLSPKISDATKWKNTSAVALGWRADRASAKTLWKNYLVLTQCAVKSSWASASLYYSHSNKTKKNNLKKTWCKFYECESIKSTGDLR